jgi:hypothetical protein
VVVRFSAPVQTGSGAYPATDTLGTGSLQGVKQLRHGVDHPPTFGAEVKEQSRAIPLLPFWALVASSRVNFMLSVYFVFTCNLLKYMCGAQWLGCCATNRKVAGSIPDDVIGIFH